MHRIFYDLEGAEKMLSKQEFVAKRNGNNLTPIDVVIPELGSDKTIKVIPLSRSKGLLLGKIKDIDRDIILNHVIEPSFTAEDLDYMKLGSYFYLIKAILKASGFKESFFDKIMMMGRGV